MNYEKLKDISTVVANVGVLLGIIVVIVEINQNTRATEAQVAWEHNNAVRELYFPVALDPYFSNLSAELRSLNTSEASELAAANDPKYAQYLLWFAIQMNMWEARFYTQPAEIDRQRLTEVILQLISDNEFDKHAASTVRLARFRPEFREYFESILQSIN